MAIKETNKIDTIYNGKVLTLKVANVSLTNGNNTIREFVERKESSAIIATTEFNEIILVEQERYGVGKILELPAGLIDKNELPIKAAIREFKEETGYSTGCIYKLTEYYTSSGFTNEKVHLFRATDLSEGMQELDINEDIKVIKVPISSLKDYILKNNSLDAKLIVALAYLSQEL